jgi:CubicO group peptidase (beta-lactamase class C family)
MSPRRRPLCVATMLSLSVPTFSLSTELLPGTPSAPTDGHAAVAAAAGYSNGSPAELSETIGAHYRSIRAVVVLQGDLPVFEYYRNGTNPTDLLPVASVGITNYVWPLDAEGHVLGAFGLLLTARDMAKIGRLYLRGGSWNGKQPLPASYVDEATQAHNRAGPPVRAADYGYLWWITKPPGEATAYFAAGSGGQLIYVVPTLDLVVVIAGNASGAGGRHLINQVIIPFVQMRAAPR